MRDLEAEARFYERRAPGLGRYFAETLWREIMSLGETGGIHPKSQGSFHKFVSATFPYAIYYKIDEGLVRIYAVFDCRRNPERLRRRLSP